MKLGKTYNWNRRDFCFDASCEFCNAKQTNVSGYDDDNYYNNVIPNMKCNSCGKSTVSEKGEVQSVAPRYNPNVTM